MLARTAPNTKLPRHWARQLTEFASNRSPARSRLLRRQPSVEHAKRETVRDNSQGAQRCKTGIMVPPSRIELLTPSLPMTFQPVALSRCPRYAVSSASSGWSMSALPPKADIRQRIEYVCFVPKADIDPA